MDPRSLTIDNPRVHLIKPKAHRYSSQISPAERAVLGQRYSGSVYLKLVSDGVLSANARARMAGCKREWVRSLFEMPSTNFGLTTNTLENQIPLESARLVRRTDFWSGHFRRRERKLWFVVNESPEVSRRRRCMEARLSRRKKIAPS